MKQMYKIIPMSVRKGEFKIINVIEKIEKYNGRFSYHTSFQNKFKMY